MQEELQQERQQDQNQLLQLLHHKQGTGGIEVHQQNLL
jgi:hypothetical protein